MFDDPVGRVGQDVVAQGLHASLDGVVVSAAAVSGEDVVDELLATSLSELEASCPHGLVDRGPFGARRGTGSELVEVADRGFGLADRVVRGGPLVERRQGALLTCRRRSCAAGHGVEHGLDWGRRCRGPVGEGRLGGDQRVELLELDDVGPVGDDPVPSILLSGGGRDEMLVDVCRADVCRR